jgi:DMSO/TMAO reductase YedYZ molybdopterin-dependent catalytic subunit
MRPEEFAGEEEYRHARAVEHAWRLAKDLGLSRRRFLEAVGAAGAFAALTGLAARPAAAQTPPAPVLKPTPPELFTDYGSNKEMRWDSLYPGGYLTPNEAFFVRNHTRTARIDAAAWRLRVDGPGVTRPLELTLDEVLGLPSVSVIRYVECAGNGRSFFESAGGKKAQGTQWKLGAIGVAEWTGVPLRELLDRAGIKATARDVMPHGLDDLKVRRPMPVAKALADDTLLVYAMNGQPLPPDHGFPARVLTPGWIGVANIKWVGRLEVSDQPLFSSWNTDSYVMIGPGFQPSPPSKGPVLSTQSLKSALELPWGGDVAAGRRLVRGRAWSPFGKIAKVDYSLDHGATWQAARLREPNIAAAWVRFDFDWDARPGKAGIRLRAADEKGNVQPDQVPFNEQGYLFNAVVEHPLVVT